MGSLVVGSLVVGSLVGVALGSSVGLGDVSDTVVGWVDIGATASVVFVGLTEGASVGECEGTDDGESVLSQHAINESENSFGQHVPAVRPIPLQRGWAPHASGTVGLALGDSVGLVDGPKVGLEDGAEVGEAVGLALGASVLSQHDQKLPSDAGQHESPVRKPRPAHLT